MTWRFCFIISIKCIDAVAIVMMRKKFYFGLRYSYISMHFKIIDGIKMRGGGNKKIFLNRRENNVVKKKEFLFKNNEQKKKNQLMFIVHARPETEETVNIFLTLIMMHFFLFKNISQF